MTGFVIDASVTLTYLLGQDEGAAYANAAMEALGESGGVVPNIWPSEVANAAIEQERRGRLGSAQVDRLLRAASRLPVEVDEGADVVVRVADIARRWDRTSYDALYLELAMRRRLPLVTLDKGIVAAARGLGVTIATFG